MYFQTTYCFICNSLQCDIFDGQKKVKEKNRQNHIIGTLCCSRATFSKKLKIAKLRIQTWKIRIKSLNSCRERLKHYSVAACSLVTNALTSHNFFQIFIFRLKKFSYLSKQVAWLCHVWIIDSQHPTLKKETFFTRGIFIF